MRLSIQAICHKGLVRDNNEDAVSLGGFFLRDDNSELTVTTPDEGFFYLLVSDGMGGHERGEEASEYTLEQIQERLSAREITPERFEDDLREAVADISRTLNERAYADGQQRPMGCTLTGVIWHYGKTYLVNAGDSRTYRFRGGILRQLTTDETERGITGDPDASKLLLNCIGGGCEGYLRISSLDEKLLPVDVLLVCSDGLSDMVSDDAIEEALANGATAEDLFKMACEGGGVDNISIILATIN
jgi:protein phosphatase